LRKVYRGWPFFRTLIDFMQMTLAESGLRIAETYSTLVADLEIRERLWERISEKYATTVSTLLLITEQKNLLDNAPVLQRSRRLRNPYVEPALLRSGEPPPALPLSPRRVARARGARPSVAPYYRRNLLRAP
jgi:phosphoenolpyruvate carboxylase